MVPAEMGIKLTKPKSMLYRPQEGIPRKGSFSKCFDRLQVRGLHALAEASGLYREEAKGQG